jgi:hypothetical protein
LDIELIDKIDKWLDKSGYPLEMFVADSIRKSSSLSVRQSWHYIDPESNNSREIDIVATASNPEGDSEVNFIFECKGTSKPWIIFSSEDTTAGFDRMTSYALTSNEARSVINRKLFDFKQGESQFKEHAERLKWFLKDERTGYSIAQAFEGNADIPYVGMMSSVKASIWLLSNSLWQNVEHRKFVVNFPVVVTNSPLFECYLDKNGDKQLRNIEIGHVFHNQHIPGFFGSCVAIVNSKSVNKYIEECVCVANELLSLVKNR